MADRNVTDSSRGARLFQEQHDELQTILDAVPAWVFYGWRGQALEV